MLTIFLAVLIFSTIVLVHELGHFLTAKFLGIKAYELSMGMGPKIFGKVINGTEYSIRIIPFGAYVRFSDDEDELFSESNSFMQKSAWDRIKVVAMGPIVNIVLALCIMIGVIYFNGFPSNKVGAVVNGMPAYESGIEIGDTIIQVGYTDTNSWEDIYKELSTIKDESPIRLLVKKASDNDRKELYITPKLQEGRYIIGISPSYERNFFKAIKYGSISTFEQSTMMIQTIKKLFVGQANIDEFAGPVGIVNVVGEATKQGLTTVFVLTALLSLNLGIINLVPIPGLDGSRILFYTYEIIARKPLNEKIESRLIMLGFLLIIGFSIFITYKDIVRLILR